MSPELLLHKFGYVRSHGTFLEGETILVMAGFCQRGCLQLLG